MAATHMEGPLFVGGIPVGLSEILQNGRGINIWVDPYYGSDGNDGLSPTVGTGASQGSGPLKHIANALALAESGRGDVIHLLSRTNSATTTGTTWGSESGNTARLGYDSTGTILPTSATLLNWNKDNTHLIGHCAPTPWSQRARISNLSTVVPATTIPMVTISANNCIIANVQFYFDSAADQADTVMSVTGSRNYFWNVHIAGMGTGGASKPASNAGSIILLLNAAQENLFEDCTIGTDTTTSGRSAANANLKCTSAATRNLFRRCKFPMEASATSPLFVNCGGVGTIDRELTFDYCRFYAATSGGASTPAALCTTNASVGGDIIFVNPVITNVSAYYTSTKTGIVIIGPAPNNGSGIGVAPA